jgi:hypothetical protein
MRKIGSPGSAKLTTINAAAAAIDIGSKMHMVAVDPALFRQPRSKLRYLHAGSASARGLVSILRSDDYRDGVDGRLLDPRLRDP